MRLLLIAAASFASVNVAVSPLVAWGQAAYPTKKNRNSRTCTNRYFP